MRVFSRKLYEGGIFALFIVYMHDFDSPDLSLRLRVFYSRGSKEEEGSGGDHVLAAVSAKSKHQIPTQTKHQELQTQPHPGHTLPIRRCY
jgi:hypothetical protein